VASRIKGRAGEQPALLLATTRNHTRLALFYPLAVGNRQYVNDLVIIHNRPAVSFTPPLERSRVMKRSTCGKDGFTLVEIMIVVAIIGLLASIAIPSYARARERAYQVTCIRNLQQIDGATHMWSLEMKKDEQEQVTYGDIRPYLRGSLACPSGGATFEGSYTLTTVDAHRSAGGSLPLTSWQIER
jgi:prepilin-type N-terminal cleavage/methylation domain-containing protein